MKGDESGPHAPDSALFESVYERANAWSRARGYAGHDPFDALNSRLFQSTPLNRSRLAWTQAFKRSPLSPRSLALVPAGRNSKGTALFALAALSRFRATRDAVYADEASIAAYGPNVLSPGCRAPSARDRACRASRSRRRGGRR